MVYMESYIKDMRNRCVQKHGEKMVRTIETREELRRSKFLGGNFCVNEKYFPLYDYYHGIDPDLPKIVSRTNYLLVEMSGFGKNLPCSNPVLLYVISLRLRTLCEFFWKQLSPTVIEYLGGAGIFKAATEGVFNEIIVDQIDTYLHKQRKLNSTGKITKKTKDRPEFRSTVMNVNKILDTYESVYTQNLLKVNNIYTSSKKFHKTGNVVPIYEFKNIDEIVPLYKNNIHGLYKDSRREIVMRREDCRWERLTMDKSYSMTLHDYLVFDQEDWFYLSTTNDDDDDNLIRSVCELRLSRLWDYTNMDFSSFMLDDDYQKFIEYVTDKFFEYLDPIFDKAMSFETLLEINPLFCQTANYILHSLENFQVIPPKKCK